MITILSSGVALRPLVGPLAGRTNATDGEKNRNGHDLTPVGGVAGARGGGGAPPWTVTAPGGCWSRRGRGRAAHRPAPPPGPPAPGARRGRRGRRRAPRPPGGAPPPSSSPPPPASPAGPRRRWPSRSPSAAPATP